MSKYVYTDWSFSMWRTTFEAEKKLAKKIFRICKNSKNKTEIFLSSRPNYIANAIGFMNFPYDMECKNEWFENTKINGCKAIKIYVNRFNKLLTRNTQILEEIKRIKKYLQLGKLSDYDKAAAIHDYLCECADYNYAFLTDENNEKGTELYDVLFNRCAICCGYSDTFKAIADFVGLECECISNDDHEWNRVKVNGEWLYLDVTWDDNQDNSIDRKYFLLNEEEFYKVHPKHTTINYDVWKV